MKIYWPAVTVAAGVGILVTNWIQIMGAVLIYIGLLFTFKMEPE